jgi:acetylornithine deacetylase
LPQDPVLGASTMNIGTLTGGRAPNIIPDLAKAEIFIRLVDDGMATRNNVEAAVGVLAEAVEVLCIPAVRLGSIDGIETTIVSYTTDIPAFGGAWGKPFLIGPGTIHVAHTTEERIPKRQLIEAVRLYQRIARDLLEGSEP